MPIIEEVIAKKKSDPEMKESVQKLFAPIREEVHNPVDPEAAIQELMRKFHPETMN